MKGNVLFLIVIVLTGRIELKAQDYEDRNGDEQHFKGHLSIFEMGVNTFAKTNYTGYSIPNFMDLNQNKSYEVNINVLRYSLGLQKVKNNIGLVTGMGFNFNDYRFSNPYTIVNGRGACNAIVTGQ